MINLAIAIKKSEDEEILPYSIMIGKDRFNEYKAIIFDDEIIKIKDGEFNENNLESLLSTLRTFITENIGEIKNVSIMFEDKDFKLMLEKLKGN